MVGAMVCQAGKLSSNLPVVIYFSFIFLKNTPKFCSTGRIACVSTHPVTHLKERSYPIHLGHVYRRLYHCNRDQLPAVMLT